MFSERLIDDVERTNERPACKYFRRAAKPLKGEKVASFERRRQHGAPKDKKWHNKKYLYELRADFARIQNEVLAQNGFSIRVDHRTLKAQQKEAEKHSDDFAANLYKRMPESYIGVIAAHEENSLAAEVKRYREIIQSKQHSLFLDDMRKKTAQEEETKFLVKQAEQAWLFLSNSPAYKSTDFEDKTLNDLNQGILSSLARIQKLKRELVGFLGARERTQKEYLPATDHLFLLDYENKMRQCEDLERLSKELIPPNTLAKNIFVHDDFKKLQIEQEEYEKALANYERDFAENCKREIFFNNANWTNLGVKLLEHYYITKEKIQLEETGRRLSDSKIRLENELTRLEKLCQTEKAQEKIALLAADFLLKNLKIAQEYETAKKRIGALYDKLQEAKKRFNAFDDGYRSLNQNRVYRVIQPESNSTKTSALKENELVAIIADALLGEEYAVQLVARSTENNLEMEKDWEMMLESDKDELINKMMVREL